MSLNLITNNMKLNGSNLLLLYSTKGLFYFFVSCFIITSTGQCNKCFGMLYVKTLFVTPADHYFMFYCSLIVGIPRSERPKEHASVLFDCGNMI